MSITHMPISLNKRWLISLVYPFPTYMKTHHQNAMKHQFSNSSHRIFKRPGGPPDCYQASVCTASLALLASKDIFCKLTRSNSQHPVVLSFDWTGTGTNTSHCDKKDTTL
ncbi:hypothetical protein GUJ93_ZPchr0004g40160 [Zizania palustris]|uniref:Uncharacterized protein n=1 Tax=Zizania palustris TaxID=103762 RepID=A0A8J5S5J7_ZIZPA|nr:hypothetical protein GUJ93_ZPchr0004g40160 [Zizania palustris]